MSSIPARRMVALGALWRALTQARRPGTPGFGDRLRSLPRMSVGALSGRYAELGRGRLALFVLAPAYLVSPIDLLPEAFLGILGLGDDAVIRSGLAGP